MDSINRRTVLATGAAALAGATALNNSADAQVGLKTIFPIGQTTIPIVGLKEVFPVRRI